MVWAGRGGPLAGGPGREDAGGLVREKVDEGLRWGAAGRGAAGMAATGRPKPPHCPPSAEGEPKLLKSSPWRYMSPPYGSAPNVLTRERPSFNHPGLRFTPSIGEKLILSWVS